MLCFLIAFLTGKWNLTKLTYYENTQLIIVVLQAKGVI